MLLNLYAAQQNAARQTWLVVPDCLIASHAANSAHGPLFFQGAFDHRQLTHDENESVMVALDRDSFARITVGLAARLRGARSVASTLSGRKCSSAAQSEAPS